MTRVSADDFSNEGIAYLAARHVEVAGVPCLALRIGFVGELGYELHLPSPHAEHVWDTLLEKGADLGVAPFGLEPQRILRLEKGHVIVSQDTDSESNLLEAAMPWIVKNDKEFEWVGKWATQQVAERGLRWMLVGFESPSGVIPVEGGQVIVDGISAGRVTSVRRSEALGKVIGLAIVPHELALEGAAFLVQVDGRAGRDARPPRPVLRPRRREAQGVTGVLDFLSPSLARDADGFHPVARSAAERLFRAAQATFAERDGWLVATTVPGEEEHRARVGIADVSHLGTLDIRPAPAADLQGDGVTTYRLSPRRALVLYPPAARSAVGEQVAEGSTRRRRDRGLHRPRPDRPRGAGAHRAADAPPSLPVGRRDRARHGACPARRCRLPDTRRAGARPLRRGGRARLRARPWRRTRRRRRAAAAGAGA